MRVIIGLIVFLALLAILTMWVVRRYGDRQPLKLSHVIPLYGGLVAIVAIIGAVVYWLGATADYRACTDRAERSEKGRAQTLLLYDSIDTAVHTDEFTSKPVIAGQPSLRAGLDINTPVLSKADCEQFKP